MFLKSALTLLLATNASAFLLSSGGLSPRPFVSRQVSLSTDPSVSIDGASESNDAADVPEVRHTIYVGNLPYGKCNMMERGGIEVSSGGFRRRRPTAQSNSSFDE